MIAGRLRHSVVLQERVESRNATGEIDVTWQDWKTVRAAVEPVSGRPVSGREYFSAQQIQADVTTRIRMRYRRGVNERMRAVHVQDYGSPTVVDVYDIVAVLDQESRHVELHLMCTKRHAEGWRTDGTL